VTTLLHVVFRHILDLAGRAASFPTGRASWATPHGSCAASSSTTSAPATRRSVAASSKSPPPGPTSVENTPPRASLTEGERGALDELAKTDPALRSWSI
jgi:hypothetical protein